jgi:hypothetical protein
MASLKTVKSINKSPIVNILTKKEILAQVKGKLGLEVKKAIELAKDRGGESARDFAEFGIKTKEYPYVKKHKKITEGLFRKKEGISWLEASVSPLDIMRASSGNIYSCISLEEGGHNYSLWSTMMDPYVFMLIDDGSKTKRHGKLNSRSICHLMGDFSIKYNGKNSTMHNYFEALINKLCGRKNSFSRFTAKCKKWYYVLNLPYGMAEECDESSRLLVKGLKIAALYSGVGILLPRKLVETNEGWYGSSTNIDRLPRDTKFTIIDKKVYTPITSAFYDTMYEDWHSKIEKSAPIEGKYMSIFYRFDEEFFEIEV